MMHCQSLARCGMLCSRLQLDFLHTNTNDALHLLIRQCFMEIMHGHLQGMDFEPGADVGSKNPNLDLAQTSFLLSVTKKLPTDPYVTDLEGNPLSVFPEAQRMKPAPPYDEGSSPLPKRGKRRRGKGRKAGTASPRPFQLPDGKGKVMISQSASDSPACLPPVSQ